MLRLVSFSILVAAAASQGLFGGNFMEMMLLNSIMNPGSSGSSGSSSSSSGGYGLGGGGSGSPLPGLGSSMSGSSMASLSGSSSPLGGGSSSLASMFGGSSGSRGSRGRGGSRGLMGMMNNPFVLCRGRDTSRSRFCRGMPFVCEMESIQQYKIPGLLQCSPMGVGCCPKNAESLMMINVAN